MTILFVSILVFPLLGFLLNACFQKLIPARYAGAIALSAVAIPFLCFLLLSQVVPVLPFRVMLFDWLNIGMINVRLGMTLDALSLWMGLMITGVGSLIHLYAIGYMQHDRRVASFFSYLNLFIFFMLILVLSDSLLGTFIGWEGVGLCSYLLIGFWYATPAFSRAANKAFIINRIGDFGFFISIVMAFYFLGTTDYGSLGLHLQSFPPAFFMVFGLGLLMGVVGKSAQFPLYFWLPDAMAGPTPVSALIHAATMVTAGIYLIARMFPLFTFGYLNELVLIVGLLTAFLGALFALQQRDIKKILAYSTMSQLGFMVTALGMGAYAAGLFHMTTHAFFKALLFLAAGSIIHALDGEQDIFKMGGLRKVLPFVHAIFGIGVLAIIGFPPFAGFFSKDYILTSAYGFDVRVFWILVGLSILTALYMCKLYFLVFWGKTRSLVVAHAHDTRGMKISLIVLAILSTTGGLLNVKHFSNIMPFHGLEIPLFLGTIVIIPMLGLFGYRQYALSFSDQTGGWLGRAAARQFGLEFGFRFIFVNSVLLISRILQQSELVITQATSLLWVAIQQIALVFKRFQNGSVGRYFVFFVMIVILLLFGVLV